MEVNTEELNREETDDVSSPISLVSDQRLQPLGTQSLRRIKLEREKLASKAKRSAALRALSLALVFCFVFMIGEIVAGYIAHSLAILTDACHLFTDVGAYALSIFSLYASTRAPSSRFSFGWLRAEVVGTLASIFTIWALVAVIVYEAVQRSFLMYKCSKYELHRECFAVDSKMMMLIGVLGMAVNVGCAAVLSWGGSHGHTHGAHGHGGPGHSHEDISDHGHSHGSVDEECATHPQEEKHTHGYAHIDGEEKKEKKNLALNAAFLHALGDCVQSVGVIIAGVFMYFCNSHYYGRAAYKYSVYNLADPVCSVIFAIITLFTTKSLLQELLGILMEGTPEGIDLEKIRCDLRCINGVQSVHDLHVWSLTAEKVSLSVHLVADNHVEALHTAQTLLERKYNILHTTIQVDPKQAGAELCATGFCSC